MSRESFRVLSDPLSFRLGLQLEFWQVLESLIGVVAGRAFCVFIYSDGVYTDKFRDFPYGFMVLTRVVMLTP